MDDKLKQIFMDLFDVSEHKFGDRLSMDDLDAWDSVTHVTLVLALEEAFGVQFSPEEASELESIKLIKLTLRDKISQRGTVMAG